jgi:hypothetical protein
MTGPVAQWIRHQSTNLGIAGSSPARVVFSSTVYSMWFFWLISTFLGQTLLRCFLYERTCTKGYPSFSIKHIVRCPHYRAFCFSLDVQGRRLSKVIIFLFLFIFLLHFARRHPQPVCVTQLVKEIYLFQILLLISRSNHSKYSFPLQSIKDTQVLYNKLQWFLNLRYWSMGGET